MSEVAKCQLCGEPMPPGEEMFNFHGYSGPCPKPPLPKLANGVELIEIERSRQVTDCGWTAENDDKQTGAELIACADRIIAEVLEKDDSEANRSSDYWPHERASHIRNKYGSNHIRRLVIAGALVAAEIDRLQRLPKST